MTQPLAYRSSCGVVRDRNGARRERRKMDVSQFLVPPRSKRDRQPWLEGELLWHCRQFLGKRKTIEELAGVNGRSALAVACALHKHAQPVDLSRSLCK